jgi:hypothetical protein
MNFIPQNSRDVIDVENGLGPGTEAVIVMQRRIFREHGWPDLEIYNKKKCLDALQTAMEQQYSEYAGYRLDDRRIHEQNGLLLIDLNTCPYQSNAFLIYGYH